MRIRKLGTFGAAALAGFIFGSLLGPRPVAAVARELIELQRDVTTLLQGQKEMTTQMTQDHTVVKTLVEQSSDSVSKLGATMGGLQKSVQDVQANSGARLDTMSTQVQGLSDNLEEIKSRLGKLNQQLVDLQNSMQGIEAKLAGAAPAAAQPPAGNAAPGAASQQPLTSGALSAANAPSADALYSNGLRDIQTGKYDLAHNEFLDYLKYYASTDLASNAQFYLGEIAYAQKSFEEAVSEYDKVLNNYPKSFKLAPALLKKGLALVELNQKSSAIRDLREVVRKYPGTEEDRRARAKLKELGASVSAAR